jgi:hypothetical protein
MEYSTKMRDTLHAKAKMQDSQVGASFQTRQEILLMRSLKMIMTKVHGSKIGLEDKDSLFRSTLGKTKIATIIIHLSYLRSEYSEVHLVE